MFSHVLSPLTKKALLLAATALPFALAAVPARASIMHADVSQLTYTDFGQNVGRYQAGQVNALLAYIRERDGGVLITYTGGQESYVLPHGMIDFGSQSDGGYDAAIGYNFLATVEHNGVLKPTYSARFVGSDNAVRYYGIEYRESDEFRHTPDKDYKITRLNKVVTDAVTSQVYDNYDALASGALSGQLLYRAGSGTMSKADTDRNTTWLATDGIYVTGGIMKMNFWNESTSTKDYSIETDFTYASNGISSSNPLPYAAGAGDSGSPCWIYDEASGTFKYIAATQSGDQYSYSIARGAAEWTNETMASYDKTVNLSSDASVKIRINAVNTDGETFSDTVDASYDGGPQDVSGTEHFGTVTDAAGTTLASFRGVQTGTHTWLALNAVMNNDNWYAYDDTYFNASSYANGGKDLLYADLYLTDNIVFKAASVERYEILLGDTIDTGIGYTRFSKADGVASAEFLVKADGGNAYLLDTAGFVIDENVSVTLDLTVPEDYVREWRKVGEGDLRVAGSGNNYALLNLGGTGTTYLERENGFAAYNVLASTGTTVVISDVNQIARDFTFGNGGAQLDFNGNSMTWNNAADVSADGFHVRALTEDAVITNTTGTVTLTVTDGGESFLGSFVDTEAGALKIEYDGGDGSSWALHGVFTDLTHHEDSGFSVASGTVSLSGTNVVHAAGSATGTDASRYSDPDDWHYADMTMNVEVKSGAAFELGAHARLTGDVSVADGGTFVMREGVKKRYEYIEGGYVLEDTDEIADFFGLKGNVELAGTDAQLKIEFCEGVTSNLTYSGNISGEGKVSVALGNDGATLTLGGNSTFSGTKTLISGGIVAETDAALGDVSRNRWLIGEQAWLAVKNDSELSSATILNLIDENSTGLLMLTGDRAEQFDLSSHSGLFLGAEENSAVQYGAAGTAEELAAENGKWTLGGGGGELVVNFRLTGNNDLVLGNEYGKGVVTLANAASDFTGTITFVGDITLNCTNAEALGNATIDLPYTLRVKLARNAILPHLKNGSDGVLLLNSWADETLDLSGENVRELALGTDGDAVFDKKITVAQDAAYRFGGLTGTLTLSQALDANGTNDLIIDAQTYSGGKIVLAQKADITGTVSVMAFDAEKLSSVSGATEGGDVTLSFAAGNDNALAKAAATNVLSGGTIDLNGTKQTLNNLSVSEGGSVIDSAGTGTLVVNSSTATALSGTVSVSSIEKTGAGTLTIPGRENVSADTLTIRGGTIATETADAFANIGKISVGAGETGTLAAGVAGTNLAALDVAPTGTLVLSGEMFRLSDKNVNASGGTLEVRSAQINLDYNESGGAQTVNGTLKISDVSPETVTIRTTGKADNVGKTIDRLEVAAGRTAVLSEDSWNTIWTIHGLSGAGDVRWDSETSHWFSSRIILDGANEDFTGTFTLYRHRYQEEYRRSYGVFVELAHDDVLRNAVLALEDDTTSYGATDYASLAVNTENAHLKGLNGNTDTHVYAGASLPGTANDSGSTLIPAPTSARQTTLTFSGDGEYAFAGTVAGDADGNGAISLVMNGAGTQSFTGSSIAVADVSALAGTLVLAPADGGSLTVSGNVAVARGASLTLGEEFSLDAGKTFTVLGAADAANLSANFTGTLLLNGGELVFSDIELSADSTALSLGGVSVSETLASQVIRFTGNLSVAAGTVYQLSNQDWSAAADVITADAGRDYLTAEISATGDGLFVTFKLADSDFLWKGTAEENSWSAAVFGPAGETVPDADGKIIFNDYGNAVVNISENVSAGTLVFDAAQDYSVLCENGAALSAAELLHTGTGTTTLGAGVSITGATTIEAGELVVRSAETLVGAVSGAGTLGVDWDGSGAVSGLGEIGTLHVIRGQYAAAETLTAGTVRVDADGQFFAQADQTADFVLPGEGWSGDSGEPAAALRIGDGVVVSGGVSLTGNSAVLVAENETATISGSVSTGDVALTKVGAGTLVFSVEVSGEVVVKSGSANFTGTVSGVKLSVEEGTRTTVETGTISVLSGTGEVAQSGSGTISIEDMRKFFGKYTKTGSGGLRVGQKSGGASWKIVGAALGESVNFNDFAADGEAVELVGASGLRESDGASLMAAGDHTFGQNFTLTADTEAGRDYGLSLDASASASVITFTGSFRGDGKFSVSGDGSDRFVFLGDMSEFAGGFSVSGGNALEFSDDGGTTVYTDAANILGSGEIVNSGKIVFNFEKDYTIGNLISGYGVIEKTGAGTLALTNALLGNTVTVSGGVLDLTRNSRPVHDGPGKLIVTDGATVRIADCGWGAGKNFGANYNNDRIYLKDGGVLEITQPQKARDGALRSFTVDSGTGVFRYSGAGTNTLEHYNQGGLDYRIALAGGATLQFDVVQADATLDVSKTIGADTNSGAVEKVGAGTLRLSGSSGYSGGTTISEGKLVAANASALGLGTIRISGGQLQIAGGVTLSQREISIVLSSAYRIGREENGGEEAVAAARERGIAAFSLRAATVADDAAPTPAIVGETGAAAGTLANDTKITLFLSEEQQNEIANLTAGSVLQYYLWEPDTVSLGTNVFAADGSDFVLAGNGWDSDDLSVTYADGILKITAETSSIPEPSAFGFLAGTAALALAFSARRRRHGWEKRHSCRFRRAGRRTAKLKEVEESFF